MRFKLQQGVRANLIVLLSNLLVCFGMFVIIIPLVNCQSIIQQPAAVAKLQAPTQNRGLITTRFGVLQCRARAQPRRESNNSSKQQLTPRKQPAAAAAAAAERETKESAESKAQGPKVIILPPIIQPQQATDDQLDNASEDSSAGEEDAEGEMEEDREGEGETTVDESESESSSSSSRAKRSERRTSQSNWLHHKMINNLRRRPLRRQRRQATETESPLVDEVTREILGLQPRRPSLLTADFLQQLISSLLLFIQQFFSLFVGRTVAELPLRMANLGQLVANIAAALTVNNPVITNSPLLRNSSASDPPPAANIVDQNRNNIVQAASQLLRALGAQSNSPSTTPTPVNLQQRNAEPTTTTTTTTTTTKQPESILSAESSTNQTSVKESDQKEVEFVQRLNDLTSSSLRPERTTATTATTAAASEKKKKKSTSSKKKLSRRKRSIASLLMFGPFSKFYMAMMLNRMLKYQSSVVSQAVMGELVRRFVMPTLTSALIPSAGAGAGQLPSVGSLASLGGAFNQVRQSLVGAIASSSSVQPAQLLPPPAGQAIKQQQQQQHQKEPEEVSRQKHQSLDSLLLDADCQLVSEPQPQGANQSNPLGSTAFAAATNIAPMMSIDQSGLHFDPPNSALKYTIPNPFHAQAAHLSQLQSAFRQLAELQPSGFPPQAPLRPTADRRRPPHNRSKMISSPYDWVDQPSNSSHVDPKFFELPPLEGAMWPPAHPGQQQQPEDAKLLNEFVTRASPNQLLAVLNQLNNQSSIKTSSGANEFDRILADQQRPLATLDGANISGSELEMLAEQQLTLQPVAGEANRHNKKHQRQSSAQLTASEIADSILSKMQFPPLNSTPAKSNTTLEPRESAEDKLVKETSKLLASSLAQLVKNLDSGSKQTAESRNASGLDSKSPIQITLSADNAMAKLMEKLLSTVDNNDNNNNKSNTSFAGGKQTPDFQPPPPVQRVKSIDRRPEEHTVKAAERSKPEKKRVAAAPAAASPTPAPIRQLATSTTAPIKAIISLMKENTTTVAGSNSSSAADKGQQPLNNLAMALNVMNMVMLNQRLAEAQASRVVSSTTRQPEAGRNRSRPVNLERQRVEQEQNSKSRSTTTTTTTHKPQRESNHRTSSNQLKSNATLLIVGQNSTLKLPKPVNYHYQPLAIVSPPINGSQSRDQSSVVSKQAKLKKLIATSPSEEEHANRWNDVLQHISLAA